jgi:hypothetical protein
MSENIDGMQTMLNIFSEYCNTWKLQVNIAKTNVVIFSKGKITHNIRVRQTNQIFDHFWKHRTLHFDTNF